MTKEQFIKEIAKYVQKYAPQFGIKVCSPVIAQACLESQYGNSELSVNANNFFGLKYRAGRCPSASGIYYKDGAEQNADGTYTNSAMQWMKFPNMELGVKGYFEFINISNYASLKGITDPYKYLETIKECKYATSLNYVSNVFKVVEKWNLTQYDPVISEKSEETTTTTTENARIKISVHAGHNPAGKTACGAVGLLNESTENRNVKDRVVAMLKAQGHTVYDDTVDNGISKNDVLKKIVAKVNSHDVDLSVSIHFNAGANKILNNTTTGTEVYVYSTSSKAYSYAQKIVNAISALGFKNRGVKTSTSLYVLKNIKAPSLLIECCFVEDPDDVALYDADKMAQAIVKGITGVISSIPSTPTSNSPSSTGQLYRVQTGAYALQKNAVALQEKLKKAGFSAIIKKVGLYYKVQIGAYSQKTNADAMLKRLKEKGFNGFITYS